jgi:DNA polymerase-3 subunit delta'
MAGDFDRIIGHKRACEVLTRMKKNDRLSHAFLFVGPDHVGKTTVARAFLSSFFPRGSAPGNHPDMLEIGRQQDEKTGKYKTVISVEQIRDLREGLSMTALCGGWKTVFIEEAQALHSAAANALLKTLEEPSGKTLFILRAPTMASVPATIASRCQILRFHFVPQEDIIAALRKRGLDKEEAKDIASLSGGAPGRAIRLIEDSAYRARMETAFASTMRLFEADLPERLRLSQELIPKDEARRQDILDDLLHTWESVLRDMLWMHLGQKAKTKETERILEKKDAGYWMRVLEAIVQMRQQSLSSLNPLLAIEHILLIE